MERMFSLLFFILFIYSANSQSFIDKAIKPFQWLELKESVFKKANKMGCKIYDSSQSKNLYTFDFYGGKLPGKKLNTISFVFNKYMGNHELVEISAFVKVPPNFGVHEYFLKLYSEIYRELGHGAESTKNHYYWYMDILKSITLDESDETICITYENMIRI